MLQEFKKFLIRSNAMALAIGVIFGAAAGKVVTALSDDVLMPIIGTIVGSKTDWRKNVLDGPVQIKIGDLVGNILDFIIIGFMLFLIAKFVVKEAMPPEPEPAPETKTCPACKEAIHPDAKKCKYCCSEV